MSQNAPRWDELTEAMQVMAAAVGAHASIKDKFGLLRVEFPVLLDSDEHAKALDVIAELIDSASQTQD